MPDRRHVFEGETAVPAHDGGTDSPSKQPHSGRVVLAALLVLVALLGLLHILRYTTFSPYDEIQHFDTLEKASRFELVGRGELLSQVTMNEAACHGVDFNWNLPSCNADTFAPADYPWQGWNTAYTASPFYYGVTGLAGRTLDYAVPAIDSLLTASRTAALSWAVLAAGMMWLLLGEFAIPRTVRFFTITLIATAPTVLHVSSIVNPDITGLVGGAAIAWLTLRWERGASPAWLLAVVGALTVLGKPVNAAVVGTMVVYLIIRYILGRSSGKINSPRFPTGGVAALIVGVLLGAVPWMLVQNSLATAPTSAVPQIIQFSGPSLTLSNVTSQLTAIVSPLRDPYLPLFIAGPLTVAVAALSNLLLVGTNAGVAFLHRDQRSSVLAATTLTISLLLGPAIVVFFYVSLDGVVFPATVRYGLPLLPLFAVSLATASSEKLLGRIALGALAITSFAVITVEMIGLM